MQATLRQYMGIAMNSVAVSDRRSRNVWAAALETAARETGMQFCILDRPHFWYPSAAPAPTLTLRGLNEYVCTADFDVTDGRNLFTVCVSLPMWLRGAEQTAERIRNPGVFAARILAELGVSDADVAIPLEVDVNCFELKLTAARLGVGALSGGESLDMDMAATAQLCGALVSADPDASAVALVHVQGDGSFHVDAMAAFGAGLVTPEYVKGVLYGDATSACEDAQLAGSKFVCRDGTLLMVCAVPIL